MDVVGLDSNGIMDEEDALRYLLSKSIFGARITLKGLSTATSGLWGYGELLSVKKKKKKTAWQI